MQLDFLGSDLESRSRSRSSLGLLVCTNLSQLKKNAQVFEFCFISSSKVNSAFKYSLYNKLVL